MRRTVLIAGLVWMALFSTVLDSFAQTKLLTAAEESDYTRTSLYAEVDQFIQGLLKSPYIHEEILGVSSEGREIPMLIIGNPPPLSAREMRYDPRLVVYFQANIHAGEVEGKEALLMLIRDLFLTENPRFLDKIVLLAVPIFNPDGNEKLGRNRRDNGPELAGVRHNGQNYDLNRDAIKMESPEVKGLVRILNEWDPVLFVDCHTTNGSYHEEPVTYSWPLNPNGDMDIIRYMRDIMMPEIGKSLKKKYNTLSIPYGNFMNYQNPEEGWSPSGPEGRYITNYIGLRNRMSILLENYAYADFKTRVLGNYHFLLSVLEYCDQNKEKMESLVRAADRRKQLRGLNPTQNDSFALDFDLKPLNRKVTILGWETELITDPQGRRRIQRTDRKHTYTVPLFYDYVPKRNIRMPAGYLVPATASDIMQKLIDHGIVVERTGEPLKVKVEAFRVKEIKNEGRLYQGHYMNTIQGEWFEQEMEFPAGSFLVRTAQSLADLAATLLEPESGDGLLVWNYFDRYLAAQWSNVPQVVPVYRVLSGSELPAR